MYQITDHYLKDDLFLKRLTILYTGHQQCPPGHTFNGLRNHYILHHILRGKGIFRYKKESYSLKDGNSFFIEPRQPNYYQADKTDPWEYIWIAFEGDAVPRLLANTSFADSPVNIAPNPSKIKKYTKIIFNLAGSELYNPVFEIYAALFQLLHYYSQKTNQRNQIAKPDYIQSAKKFIHNNYQNSIKTDQLAKYLGLNRSYFSHLFKQTTGTGLIEYLKEYRISRAKELLKKTDYTVIQISYTVGFYDYYYFLKVFKQATGLTPGEYRKNREVI